MTGTIPPSASLPLWPHQTDRAGTGPALTFYPAPRPDPGGATVLILPGGGYEFVAEHEGPPIARRLNEHGLHAAVLTYRVGPVHRHPAMAEDAERAIRLLRAHAAEQGVGGDAVAVLGFSAGGHLASTLGVFPGRFAAADDDLRGRVSARPDALVLCYPVIDLGGPWAHAGSRLHLLGVGDTDEAAALLSTQDHVSADTPPTFLWHTADDELVPVENSLAFAAACRRERVPVELHVYETAPHGVGLADDLPDVQPWVDACVRFLRRHLSA